MHTRAFNRKGQGLVEYALIIGLIGVFCIAAVTSFSTSFDENLMAAITTALKEASEYIATGLGKGKDEAPPPIDEGAGPEGP